MHLAWGGHAAQDLDYSCRSLHACAPCASQWGESAPGSSLGLGYRSHWRPPPPHFVAPTSNIICCPDARASRAPWSVGRCGATLGPREGVAQHELMPTSRAGLPPAPSRRSRPFITELTLSIEIDERQPSRPTLGVHVHMLYLASGQTSTHTKSHTHIGTVHSIESKSRSVPAVYHGTAVQLNVRRKLCTTYVPATSLEALRPLWLQRCI